MATLAACLQGHQWEPLPTQPGETAQACPVCGGAAMSGSATLLTSPPEAVKPAHVETHPPSTSQAPPTRVSFPTGGDSSAETPIPAFGSIQVPGYEILRELGRGGMGVVYEARQIKLNRIVALKMILHGGHAGQAALARFRTEAEAIARLQHPNIVQIHEIGECDGLPFFSLEFCSGGNLDGKLKGVPLPPLEAAALVETLARAMDAAHQAGVVHRDLKPANVLLNKDGQPKVTDFGLAKKVDEAGQTASGAIIGTPSYMPPEQAQGRVKELGPAADVYALGAILYECLTGRPPFKAATIMDTLLQVVGDEPVPPTRLNAKVPGDLEVVCLKCLRKEARQRYDTALDLAEELHRFRAGEPIRARSAGRVERGWRWCKRNPAVAALLALVALALPAGTMVSTYFAVEEKQARKNSDREKVEKERQLDLAQTALVTTQLQRVAAIYTFDTALCRDLLRDENVIPVNRRDFAWDHYDRLCKRELLTLDGGMHEVDCVAFSPDGKTLVSATDEPGQAAEIKVWDVASVQERAALHGHSAGVTILAFSPDGRTLASGSKDRTVRLWGAAIAESPSPDSRK